MTWIDSRSVFSVVGAPFVTRTAESPRPMPHTVRLPYISFSVANTEAVTVQSRVAGFVTNGPTLIRFVSFRIAEWMTYGSSHSRWESKVHTWLNPNCSASFARWTVRDAGGLVCRTAPKSIRPPSDRSRIRSSATDTPLQRSIRRRVAVFLRIRGGDADPRRLGGAHQIRYCERPRLTYLPSPLVPT